MSEFNSISTVSTFAGSGSAVFASAEIASNSPTLMSESINGRKQVKTQRSQNWQFRAQFVPMTNTEFKPIYAFLANQRGMFGQFTVNLPVSHEGTITAGTATGTAGATSITVTPATGTTLKAGDFIGFSGGALSNHYKAYMVTQDVTISGSGTVNIMPALVKSESGQAFDTGTSVDFLVRLATDVQQYQVGADGYYRHEVTFEEVI